MSGLQVREDRTLVLPTTGEVVNLDDESSCALALEQLRQAEQVLGDMKRQLVEAIVARSELLGSRTLDVRGGKKAIVKTSPTVQYDAEEIELGLRAAGMPEDRIRQIVKEEISYRVAATEAKKAAGANAAYREVIERHSREVESRPTVSVVNR